MAVYLAPTTEYKAPTFQELFAPLAIYKDAYDKVKEKYDAEADKAALLKAMMGTDPNNEVSQYMSSYNNLLDETSQMIANNVPYSQLARNTAKLKQMWRDKGVPATTAIEALTKYRDARSKVPGAIGRELTFNDFLADPNKGYSIVDPERIRAAAVVSGQTFAQNNPLRVVGKGPNRQLMLSSDASDERIANDLLDESTQLGRDFSIAMKQYGISDEDAQDFANIWVSGLTNSRKFVYQNDVVANEQAAFDRQKKMYEEQQKQQNTYNTTPQEFYPGSDVYFMPNSGIRLKKEGDTFRPLTEEENIEFSKSLPKAYNPTTSDETPQKGIVYDTREEAPFGAKVKESNGNIYTSCTTIDGEAATTETWKSDKGNCENIAKLDENGVYVPDTDVTLVDLTKDSKAHTIATEYCSKYRMHKKYIRVYKKVEDGTKRDKYIIVPMTQWNISDYSKTN